MMEYYITIKYKKAKSTPIGGALNLSHLKRAVRLLPQAFGETKKSAGRSTAHKGPISVTNHQWGMKEPPTDGVFYKRFSNSSF